MSRWVAYKQDGPPFETRADLIADLKLNYPDELSLSADLKPTTFIIEDLDEQKPQRIILALED